jgi:hypothetical protein
MIPYLITMLTNNDVTVENAKEIFLSCSDLDCEFWGFKDIGLPQAAMIDLVHIMKEKGKSTFLEVVSLKESESERAAERAIECGFDYLMGTIYSPKVHRMFMESKTKYFPFCGSVHGHPTILEGTPGDILRDAKGLEKLHVSGVDLLAYRNALKPEEAARLLVGELKIPVVIAGSIDSFQRIDRMKEIRPWAFTIGSAFFSKRFVPDGSFRDQLQSVISYLAA